MSRALSPDDAQGGPPLSKVMFIKRMIDEDLPEKEIDRRCALIACMVYVFSCFAEKGKVELYEDLLKTKQARNLNASMLILIA